MQADLKTYQLCQSTSRRFRVVRGEIKGSERTAMARELCFVLPGPMRWKRGPEAFRGPSRSQFTPKNTVCMTGSLVTANCKAYVPVARPTVLRLKMYQLFWPEPPTLRKSLSGFAFPES